MTRKAKRLTLIISALAVLGVAAGLIMFALRDNIVFLLHAHAVRQKHRLRAPLADWRAGEAGLGGQGRGSRRESVITDNAKELAATYTGLLPDLFREGQGVVADGVLRGDGTFRADSVLAKHDERYMPRDVADALKKQGVWQGRQEVRRA